MISSYEFKSEWFFFSEVMCDNNCWRNINKWYFYSKGYIKGYVEDDDIGCKRISCNVYWI